MGFVQDGVRVAHRQMAPMEFDRLATSRFRAGIHSSFLEISGALVQSATGVGLVGSFLEHGELTSLLIMHAGMGCGMDSEAHHDGLQDVLQLHNERQRDADEK